MGHGNGVIVIDFFAVPFVNTGNPWCTRTVVWIHKHGNQKLVF